MPGELSPYTRAKDLHHLHARAPGPATAGDGDGVHFPLSLSAGASQGLPARGRTSDIKWWRTVQAEVAKWVGTSRMTISKIVRRKADLLKRWCKVMQTVHPQSTRAPLALPESAAIPVLASAAPTGLVTPHKWRAGRFSAANNISSERLHLEPAWTAGDLVDAVVEDLAQAVPLNEQDFLNYMASDVDW